MCDACDSYGVEEFYDAEAEDYVVVEAAPKKISKYHRNLTP
jgi:hypothetical protein